MSCRTSTRTPRRRHCRQPKFLCKTFTTEAVTEQNTRCQIDLRRRLRSNNTACSPMGSSFFFGYWNLALNPLSGSLMSMYLANASLSTPSGQHPDSERIFSSSAAGRLSCFQTWEHMLFLVQRFPKRVSCHPYPPTLGQVLEPALVLLYKTYIYSTSL